MEISLNCRVLLYGFIIFVLFKSDEKETVEKGIVQDNKNGDNDVELQCKNDATKEAVQTNLSEEET